LTKPPVVVLAGLGTALSLFGDTALYAILPVRFGELGLLPAQVGLLLSANRWVRLASNQPARRVLDRVGPAILLPAALVTGSLISLCYASRPVFWAFLAARLLWGVCWSFIRQASVSVSIASAARGRSGRALGLFTGIVQAGYIAGNITSGFLYDATGPSATFVWMAVLSLTAVPFGAWAARDGAPAAAAAAAAAPRALRATVELRVLGFLGACVGTGLVMSTVGYSLKQQLGDNTHLGALAVGITSLNALLLSVRYVIDGLGSPLLGRLIDRAGTRSVAVTAFGAGAIALLAAAAAGTPVATILLVVIFFVCAASFSLALQVTAAERGPAAYAGYVSAADLGAAVGPLLGWLGIQYVTRPWATLLAGGVLLLAAAAIALTMPGRRRWPSSPAPGPARSGR
jgi:MFS family permease